MMSTDWADVPDDLLYLLSERLLGLCTFLRFGAVCKYWHSFTLANQKLYKPSPWLMLSEKEATDVREFFDISTGEVYELPLPQARDRKINGSAHGWLMTVGDDPSMFSLLNPLDGTQIKLPPMQSFLDDLDPSEYCLEFLLNCRHHTFMRKATWSANPGSTGDGNDDFTVMAVHLNDQASCLSFCRPSEKEWTSFHTLTQNEVAFAGGQFYAIACGGVILSCDICNKLAPKHSDIASTPENWGLWGRYIVECGKELLVVERRRKCLNLMNCGDDIYHTVGFSVYKLDLVGKKLVEIKDIGDYALFVGCNDSISLQITSDYPSKNLRRNCIYFTDDFNEDALPSVEAQREDMGVYSLDDQSIQPFYLEGSISCLSFPIWFTPNLCQG